MDKRWLGHTFSLLHADYVRLDEKWNYTHVVSPYFRIYYIDEGEGFIISTKEKCRLEKDHLYIIPSFTLCHLCCDHYLSQHFLHFFEESPNGLSLFENNRKVIKVQARDIDVINFKRLLEINPGRGINRSDNPKVYERNVYYKRYQELNSLASDACLIETQGIIYQLISRFIGSRQFKSGDPHPMPSKILESISHIRQNLKNHLTVSTLAKKANLHQDYFSRLFLRYTGERPLNYIHVKRIERAQYLIATTRLSYTQIAEATGFESLPYFTKIFKKVTGLTPGEYRKRSELV
ncbi:MAG: helix-turn-helix transcriptional regulator [Chitinophagaceae bacterium]|nr:helix-turn-helix transcriptional regulator [Chitinophagaceae bacterium]